MRGISGKEFSKILERNGWMLRRVQGSHHIFGNPQSTVRISVPFHGNKTLKKGLLNHLMKQAELTAEDMGDID